MSSTTISDFTAVTPEHINSVLSGIEEESRHSRTLHSLGIDTEMVGFIKSLFGNPGEFFGKMAELPSHLFVTLFLSKVNEAELKKIIHSVGVRFEGSLVNIWIFIKKDEYSFEARSNFYRLNASLLENEVMSKVHSALMVLCEGETEMPTDFKVVPLDEGDAGSSSAHRTGKA